MVDDSGRAKLVIPYGRNRIAYAVLRSLADTVDCYTADSVSLAMCRFSRRSKGYFKYPKVEGDFVVWAKERWADGYLLFPTFEEAWTLRRHHEFEDVLPSPEVIDRANNKWEVHQACEKAGVPTPKSYPMMGNGVLKPIEGRGSQGRQFLHNVLLQERVYGPSLGVGMLWHNKALKAKCVWRRITEFPADGGWSVICQTTVSRWHEECSERLMQALGWTTGPCMVEWKGDYVIEVNPRFWGSLGLSIRAGVDFPRLVLDIMQRGQCKPVFQWEEGLTMSYAAGCLMRRVRPRGPTMDWDWKDPLPFFGQFGTAASNAVRGRGLVLDGG